MPACQASFLPDAMIILAGPFAPQAVRNLLGEPFVLVCGSEWLPISIVADVVLPVGGASASEKI